MGLLRRSLRSLLTMTSYLSFWSGTNESEWSDRIPLAKRECEILSLRSLSFASFQDDIPYQSLAPLAPSRMTLVVQISDESDYRAGKKGKGLARNDRPGLDNTQYGIRNTEYAIRFLFHCTIKLLLKQQESKDLLASLSYFKTN